MSDALVPPDFVTVGVLSVTCVPLDVFTSTAFWSAVVDEYVWPVVVVALVISVAPVQLGVDDDPPGAADAAPAGNATKLALSNTASATRDAPPNLEPNLRIPMRAILSPLPCRCA